MPIRQSAIQFPDDKHERLTAGVTSGASLVPRLLIIQFGMFTPLTVAIVSPTGASPPAIATTPSSRYHLDMQGW